MYSEWISVHLFILQGNFLKLELLGQNYVHFKAYYVHYQIAL